MTGNNGHDRPSDREWADASLTVNRVEFGDPDLTMLEFVKSVTKKGQTFKQSCWLNIRQLQSVARDPLGK